MHDEALPWIETPLIESAPLSKLAGCRVSLKLENLQPSGSFKSRGVGNMVRTAVAAHPRAHFYISSGGNAGIACVLAAARYGRPATVVVPLNALPLVTTNLRAAGAKDVILAGASWREADAYLRTVLAADADGVYVPPFDHPDVWAGAATMGAEIEAQLGGTADVVVASVGGGGLFSGLMQGLSADTRVVAVETEGAASLHASVRAGHLVTLPAITSIATSLGATRVAPHAFQQAQRPNVTTTTVTDAQAVSACARFLDDHRMLVEAACGATLALVYSSLLQAAVPGLKPESRVVLVVCGGSNIDMRLLAQYRKQFNV